MLGPLRISGLGVGRVGSPLQLRLVALLLSRAGQPVHEDVLMDGLWPRPTSTATNRLHLQVHRLRKALGDPGRIVKEPGGYRLLLNPGELDAERFELFFQEGGEAVRSGDLRSGVNLFRKALELWQGEAYAGLVELPGVDAEAARLSELRLSALEQVYGAGLGLGAGPEVVSELREVAERHPLRERFQVLLMIALSQADRQADALAVYRSARQRLVDELGLEPGPDLRRIEAEILAGGTPSLGVGVPSRPQQLPPAVRGFVGREAELATLAALVGTETAGDDLPMIVALTGGGGVGKTALAVQWASSLRDRFADGQLFVDLRGYGTDRPRPPAEVLDFMLRSLGVPGESVPADQEARTAMLRTRLADRRMILMLDNARDARQVRPLLPGGPSLVIVTSRSQLRSLGVDGGHWLAVNPLDMRESQHLIAERLAKALPGEGALGEPDRDLVAELATLCDRVPLALVLAAERAARYPGGGLPEVVRELRDQRSRLDVLDNGEDDESASLRAVFGSTYRALDPDTARVFRLVGALPCAGPSVAAVAAAIELPRARVRRSIDNLTGVHLVRAHAGGRIGMHDLLRAYAAEQATGGDGTDAEAIVRLVHWYSRTAVNAKVAMGDRAPAADVAPPEGGPAALTFADQQSAVGWFDAELGNLLQLVEWAERTQRAEPVFQLAQAMFTYLDVRHASAAAIALHQRAVRAARLAGNVRAEALSANQLGTSLGTAGRYDEATRSFRQALALFRRVGDHWRQGVVHDNLGVLLQLQDRLEESYQEHLWSLAAYEQSAEPDAEKWSLANIAMLLVDLGQVDEALAAADRAVEIFVRTGDRRGEAATVDTLGAAYAKIGRPEQAVSCFQRAADLRGELGYHADQAASLTRLGQVQRAACDPAGARRTWLRVLEILDGAGIEDNAKVSRIAVRNLLAGGAGDRPGPPPWCVRPSS